MSKLIGDITGVPIPSEFIARGLPDGALIVTASIGRVIFVGSSTLDLEQARSLAQMLVQAAHKSELRAALGREPPRESDRHGSEDFLAASNRLPTDLKLSRYVIGVPIPPELLTKGLPAVVTVLASLEGVELVGEASISPEQALSLAQMLQQAATESGHMKNPHGRAPREPPGSHQTYKLVKGKLDELEGLLNAAVAQGYTQLFREFPPPSPMLAALHDPNRSHEPEIYAFMMRRPDPDAGLPGIPSPEKIEQYASVFRELMELLGFANRFPPFPTGGSQAPS